MTSPSPHVCEHPLWCLEGAQISPCPETFIELVLKVYAPGLSSRILGSTLMLTGWAVNDHLLLAEPHRLVTGITVPSGSRSYSPSSTLLYAKRTCTTSSATSSGRRYTRPPRRMMTLASSSALHTWSASALPSAAPLHDQQQVSCVQRQPVEGWGAMRCLDTRCPALAKPWGPQVVCCD